MTMMRPFFRLSRRRHNHRVKFFDRSPQLVRVPGIGDVVRVVDNNDVAAETGNGAVKGGRVQFATRRGRKICRFGMAFRNARSKYLFETFAL